MSEKMCDPPLDPGIRHAVEELRAAGVETFESCDGGPEHSLPKPTMRFHGEGRGGLPRPPGAAMKELLPVHYLRRTWRVENGDPTGPCWETVCWPPNDFYQTSDPDRAVAR